MNTERLTHRLIHSHALIFCVALLAGLALALTLPQVARAQGPVITDTFLHMETFTVTADSNWTTVNLSNTYHSMIVVCTPNYDDQSAPMVTRVSNACGYWPCPGNSFQLRLQMFGCDSACSGTGWGCPDITTQTVHCLVMEEGKFTLPDGNDTKVEAQKYNSTVTNGYGTGLNWNGETQSYLWGMGIYTNPVVLGQVMSDNDPDWSVFWACDGTTQNPPDSGGLWTGKHLSKESDDITRADETIGFIVINESHGTITRTSGITVEYEARVSPVGVAAVENNPPYPRTFQQAFSSAPDVGVVSHAGENGGHGCWPLLYGANPLRADQIDLAVDESRENSIECARSHTTEQVAYWVFEESLAAKADYHLSISKVGNPDPANAGEPLVYTITYANNGNETNTNVTITETYDSKVDYHSANPAPSSGDNVWNFPSVAPGNYTIVVTVTVNAGVYSGTITNTVAIASDQLTTTREYSAYTTVNEPPVADAGTPQYVSLGANVTLDGSASSDPDGHLPLVYKWVQIGCDPPGCPVVTLTPSDDVSVTQFTAPDLWSGVITFTLAVTDNLGLAGPTSLDFVTVTVENVPVAGLSVINSSTTTLGCTTYFTATIDKGSSVTYTWDFGDNTPPIVTTDIAHESYADHIYTPTCVTTPITYTVVVTAQNGFITNTVYTVYTDTATTIVTITNDAPVADAGPPQRVVVDALVTLDGSGSHDPDYLYHDIADYYWEQTGGIVTATLSDNTAVSPTFTAPQALTMPTVLTFTLTITDDGCLTATAVTSVTVVLPVGGYTEPVSTLALLWPWVAPVAALGAGTVGIAAAVFKKRRERKHTD